MDAFERGVRQAIEWLRADYQYGDGPDWREHGAEWIAERLAEWRREGCDCAELCSMGPTCPGGMLANLPRSGCGKP